MKNSHRPDCIKCRHLKITWQMERPYACLAMGFKSHRIPWQEVVRASGKPCLMFQAKGPADKDNR